MAYFKLTISNQQIICRIVFSSFLQFILPCFMWKFSNTAPRLLLIFTESHSLSFWEYSTQTHIQMVLCKTNKACTYGWSACSWLNLNWASTYAALTRTTACWSHLQHDTLAIKACITVCSMVYANKMMKQK